MLTPKYRASTKFAWLGDWLRIHQDSAGGLIETDEMEFTVIPIIRPSGVQALTMAMPVAKQPNAFRMSRGSISNVSGVWLMMQLAWGPTQARQQVEGKGR